MASIHKIEDLVAYQKAREFRKGIASVARKLPSEEKHRLIDQIIRASRSISANIAEGFGVHHHLENAQFCRRARGSLVETMDHLNCAFDEGYLTENELSSYRNQSDELLKILNGYIAYLIRCTKEGVPSHTQQLNNPTT